MAEFSIVSGTTPSLYKLVSEVSNRDSILVRPYCVFGAIASLQAFVLSLCARGLVPRWAWRALVAAAGLLRAIRMWDHEFSARAHRKRLEGVVKVFVLRAKAKIRSEVSEISERQPELLELRYILF